MEAVEAASKPIASKTLVATVSEIYRRKAQQENRIHMKISDRMKDCNCEAISTEIWTMTDYRVTQRENSHTTMEDISREWKEGEKEGESAAKARKDNLTS